MVYAYQERLLETWEDRGQNHAPSGLQLAPARP
jgi:hypothetical protein